MLDNGTFNRQTYNSWTVVFSKSGQKFLKRSCIITNCLLRNPEIHYRPYISSPLVPISSKTYPISTSLKSILILSSHRRLDLPEGLFPSGFSTKTLCISGSLHMCYMSCPSQSSRFKTPNLC